MTEPASEAAWVGTFTVTVTLSDSEKKCIEAIALLGSYTVDIDTDENVTDAVDHLHRLEFLTHEKVGETFSRGRSRDDGIDIYRSTETAKAWLANCRPVGDEEVPR
jgi:hypothetical protein